MLLLLKGLDLSLFIAVETSTPFQIVDALNETDGDFVNVSYSLTRTICSRIQNKVKLAK